MKQACANGGRLEISIMRFGFFLMLEVCSIANAAQHLQDQPWRVKCSLRGAPTQKMLVGMGASAPFPKSLEHLNG